MNKIKMWMLAARAPFFTATLIPIVLGTVIAWYQTAVFSTGRFFLALIGGILIHAGLNMMNDYYDHLSGVDEINQTPTPFSGGSRMIQNGILKPRQVLLASLLCFAAGAVIGLYLNFILPGNTILIVGIIGMFFAIFYTANPLHIGYTGLGEITCFLGFGPVMVLGSYYVQNPQFSWFPVLASVPVAILIAAVLYINEFPDYISDKEKNKRTLVVILGKAKAIKIYYILIVLTYLWVAAGIALNLFPLSAVMVIVTIPIAVSAIKTAQTNYDKIDTLIPVNAATIKLHFSIGALLSLSFLIGNIF